MSLIETIKKWYKGKFIKGTPTFTTNEGNKFVIHLCTDRYEQPPLAKLFKYISKCCMYTGKFCAKNYKWLVTTAIAFAALILALF